MSYVTVNNIKLYYEFHGDGGSPLLLISGYGQTCLDWDTTFIRALSKRHRVILFDNRSIGRSEQVSPPYSMTRYACDAVGLLDAMQIGQAHVVGRSMGGMIAQHLALDCPDHLLSLTLISSSPGGSQTKGVVPPTAEVRAQLVKPPSEDRAQDIRESWWIGYTSAYIESHRRELESKLLRQLDCPPPDPAVLEGQARAITMTHETLARLPEIDCPTLIQTGAEDILIPPGNSRLMASRIPNAVYHQYSNCAHGLIEESEGAATEDLLKFLKQVDCT